MIAKVIAWGRDRPEALARLRVRAARDHRRAARRHDDQVLPARPARPARGRRRDGRHRLAGPHRHRRRGRRRRRTPTWRWSRWPSTSADAEEAAGARGVPRLRPWRAAARLATRWSVRSSSATRPGLPADRRAASAPTATGSRSTAATSTSRLDRLGPLESRLAVGDRRWSVVAVEAHRRRTWSRSTASPTGSPATPAGVVRAPAPAVVVAAAGGARRGGRGRPDRRRPREHEDGDGGARAVRRHASARSSPRPTRRSTPAPPLLQHRPRRWRGRRGIGGAGRPARTTAATRPGRAGPRALAAGGAAGADHRLRRQRRLRPAARGRVRLAPGASSATPTTRPAAGRAGACSPRSPTWRSCRATAPPAPRRRPTQQVHSPREFFHAYLHSLDIEREELPESFRARLSPGAAALRRRRRWSRRPALEEAVYRIFLAQQRTGRPAARGAGAARPLAHRGRAAHRSRAGGGRRRPRPARRRHPAALPRRSATSPARCASATSRSPSSRPTASTSSRRPAGCWPSSRRPRRGGDTDGVERRVEALVESPEPLIRLLAERAERRHRRPRPGPGGADPALLPQPGPAERALRPGGGPALRHRATTTSGHPPAPRRR